jgi:hypothetical protein
MAWIRNIGAALGRMALIALWLLLSPQLILQGWSWDGGAAAGPSPLQNHEPLAGEPGETEELAEDSDDRFAWQAESAAVDHAGLVADSSAGSAFVRSSTTRSSLFDRFLLRPPTVR